MQARLKVLHDKANVKQVKLLPVTLIGRSTECNLKIASSQVSRNHCRITLGDDAVFVEDLGSANGTLVDGQPIPPHQPTAIAPGAHLIVGPAEFQIDYVASTSATMVLGHSSVPPAPDLPSTEMIFPANPNPVPVSVPVLVPVVAEAAIPHESAAPVLPASAAESLFVPQVADEPAAFPPADFATTAVASRDSDTQFLDSAESFGFTDRPGEADEQTQFMFQETVPDSIPTSTTSDGPAEQETKRSGGLKSLFSMFGRKEKAAASATYKATAAASPAAAPSVFLPIMDAQGSLEASEAIETVEFENPVPVPASAADTTELAEGTTQTSSEADDGFQQFLSKL